MVIPNSRTLVLRFTFYGIIDLSSSTSLELVRLAKFASSVIRCLRGVDFAIERLKEGYGSGNKQCMLMIHEFVSFSI